MERSVSLDIQRPVCVAYTTTKGSCLTQDEKQGLTLGLFSYFQTHIVTHSYPCPPHIFKMIKWANHIVAIQPVQRVNKTTRIRDVRWLVFFIGITTHSLYTGILTQDTLGLMHQNYSAIIKHKVELQYRFTERFFPMLKCC